MQKCYITALWHYHTNAVREMYRYGPESRAQVMVPQLPFNATTPLPPRVSGSENEVPQIRGVFLNYDQIHTKK